MSYKSIFILGRQPAIGRAELESLFGAQTLDPITERVVACSLGPEEINFARLGGSVRLAKLVADFDSDKWPEILRELTGALPRIIDTLPPEGKIKLGLSVFGLQARPKQLFAGGLELKKICKNAGRSVRLVPNTEPELSSAQVLHNHLTGELGVELLLIQNGRQTILAQTVAVQDIEAYAKRDQNRPKRDPRVGMLPPKLAQIMVNMAAGSLPPTEASIVLDPFCGTGVVLQEALLAGFGAYGTDLESRMIDYSRQNLEWLATTHGQQTNPALEVGDATNYQWKLAFSVVASETYLGRPLSSWPSAEILQKIMDACNVIIEKFLRNISEQVKPGARFCLAVPCWKSPGGRFYHLPLLDHLDKMGYNRVSFAFAATEDLIYYRPNQIVTRELLVITRK